MYYVDSCICILIIYIYIRYIYINTSIYVDMYVGMIYRYIYIYRHYIDCIYTIHHIDIDRESMNRLDSQG